ncbi:J domain-containing protein [Erythrobacter sp. JK5]|uniref:J domain-containing protein n=1 Tax=Erythrobacter sp. JK5 TaxID=2829500 RepID=UPI001BAE0230|nr:J domain-containing protein [Erythrobacter sp. JK5]QUL37446.1 J domain-containing protein [Erythrobacter sp. JK5]
MLRIAFILLLVCVIWRWAFGQWPWAALSAKPTRSQAIFNARKLLGVEAGAGRDEIKAAHKRLIALVHPDRGGSNGQVHEANAARDLLLDALPDRGADIRVETDEHRPD